MSSIATLDAVNTMTVQFHGQPIITAMLAGTAYVAMKPIVENLGMSWSTQQTKLIKQLGKFNHVHMNMVAADGKIRSLLCLPLKKLNGWLFSINPERVRADIKDKLIQYQEECFSVLHEYWTKGEVKKKSRQSTATQLTPLRQTAERLIATGLGKLYPDIWKFVHKKFDIEHINQLQPEQIGEAVEYLNVLEGEFIAKGEKSKKVATGNTEERYRVRVIIYDNVFGGCVEMLGIGDTFRAIANGIATDLGYKPHAFTHVGANKEKMKRIF
ncbi:Phage anti-repressor protein [Serratia grimesii]|uniref:phage antirepressor N-terminal domain-containing protein n=1 Tax=Serratia grimesii TaxID=82995 RepID=UPI00217C7847|nr:phage antirepressor N-terminal domain-containing protein [Serratia grimesii]CAI1840972.1 Phage anti-repressor protein [Serratia grimesii]